jgi:hypothetical protein
MKLSIIITHHNTLELLDLCIKSIKDTVKDLSYEVIVVDSEADEGNKEFLKDKYSEVGYLAFEKNLGYSKIVNEGIKKAVGEYILILNADIIVLENTISEMVTYLDKHKDVGIVGPQLLDFTNNIQISCFTNPTPKTILARRTFLGKTKWGKDVLKKFTVAKSETDTAKEVDWVQGSAMMFRKSAIEKVGLWDENFFMYFEDADWCRRFWQNNLKVVYLTSAKMVHYYHRSSKKFGIIIDVVFNKYTRTHIISAIKYFKKYGF